jgi:hypothetical protein
VWFHTALYVSTDTLNLGIFLFFINLGAAYTVIVFMEQSLSTLS